MARARSSSAISIGAYEAAFDPDVEVHPILSRLTPSAGEPATGPGVVHRGAAAGSAAAGVLNA